MENQQQPLPNFIKIEEVSENSNMFDIKISGEGFKLTNGVYAAMLNHPFLAQVLIKAVDAYKELLNEQNKARKN